MKSYRNKNKIITNNWKRKMRSLKVYKKIFQKKSIIFTTTAGLKVKLLCQVGNQNRDQILFKRVRMGYSQSMRITIILRTPQPIKSMETAMNSNPKSIIWRIF